MLLQFRLFKVEKDKVTRKLFFLNIRTKDGIIEQILFLT